MRALDRIAVVAASDIRHGDYQSNAAMMLAKAAKKNPRALAEEVLALIEPKLAGKAQCSLAGPGFINFKLEPSYFAEKVASILSDDRLGVPLTEIKSASWSTFPPQMSRSPCTSGTSARL